MSAIDNAFIRAYTGESNTAEPPVAKRSAPATSAQGTAAGKPGRPHFVNKAPRSTTESTIVPAPHINLSSFAHSVSTFDMPKPPKMVAVRIDPPAVARRAPHKAPGAAPTTTSKAPAIKSASAVTAARQIEDVVNKAKQSIAVEATADSQTATPKIRAAYEVDRFTWPETCETITSRVATEADELAHELLAEAALGRKVVAVSGCGRDEGQTTIALVLARRLAIANGKVALVDANFADPQLAARLGLVIGIGWESALALPEKTSLAATMVESLEDRLTIVPLGSRSRLNVTPIIAARVTECLAELRDSFDIVLLDAGPVENSPQFHWLTAQDSGIDAAVLISDARAAANERLTAAGRKLLDSKIAPLGIVENFCA
jgi:Mrp family chromosome partitioning ATPase